MPRPKTKEELLFQSQGNYQKLIDLVNSFSVEEQQKDFPKGTMNRNIRDVLAHLHHWHLMFLEWYKIGMNGKKPPMPAKDYTWKMTPELNRWIFEKYQKMELSEAKKCFENSHQKVQHLIENHSNEELFTKKKYHWTGSTSLGSYLVSTTSSHYQWGIQLIKKSK